MDLKSIFQRDKSATSAPSPQPPSVREMLEDIESSSKNDPVYLFANYLQRKGARKASLASSLDSSLTDSISTTPGGVSRSRSRNSESESTSTSVPSTPVNLMTAPFPENSPVDQSGGDSTEAIYYKLRQFLSLTEQTQEMTSDVEEKLRKFELEYKDFIKTLNETKTSVQGSELARKKSLASY